jgi:succinylglutamate desuccinylase
MTGAQGWCKKMSLILEPIPDALLSVSPAQLHEVCSDLTLFELKGKIEQPLLVSAMLHGDEPGGLYAVQEYLRRLGSQSPERTVLILIGNVQAAKSAKRKCDDGIDFNRIWSESARHNKAAEILAYLNSIGIYASLDIHNSSGRNPVFSILAHMHPESLYLSARIGGPVMYAPWPKGPLSHACGKSFPSVTVEMAHLENEKEISRFADTIAWLTETADPLAGCKTPYEVPDVFEMRAIARIDTQALGAQSAADFHIEPNLDDWNFRDVPVGTTWATTSEDGYSLMEVVDAKGRSVKNTFFRYGDGYVESVQPITPALLTVNRRAVEQDCFCYITQSLKSEELEQVVRGGRR